MIVVDASATVALLLRVPEGEAVAERLSADPFHAPHLIDVEVANALRGATLRGEILDEIAWLALVDFANLTIVRYPQTLLLARIWELRRNLTAYDAAYVALAEALEAPLLTTDARLSRTPGHDAHVELIQ